MICSRIITDLNKSDFCFLSLAVCKRVLALKGKSIFEVHNALDNAVLQLELGIRA